jgi:ABC-type protease/lipase transport system fused ATPase/permease subunit
MPAGMTRPILQNINFTIEAGQSLGVIGPTAAGKSTLARLIVGIYPPNVGVVRLDGANVYTWERTEFGRYVGYVPQDIELFAGTVADNIARFRGRDSEAIVQAAQAADAHDMIVRLSDGYETQVGEGGAMISPGQRQRIALARALYGKPALVVLDEPNSNLDSEGDNALANAIANLKRNGTTVVIVTHRIALLNQFDRILALQNGAVLAFGSPAEVRSRLQGPVVGTASAAASSSVAIVKS